LPFDQSTEKNVTRIALALSKTAGIQETAAIAEILPDYGYSIKRVWVLSDGGCLIDLRPRTLKDETDAFLRNRGLKETRPQAYCMDAYFRSLTASIFSAQAGCKSIRYLLDGTSDSPKDMAFDLRIVHLP